MDTPSTKTTDPASLPVPDDELLPLATYTVYQIKQGEMLSLMMHLGDRLGLFRSMADGAERTATAVAEAAGIHERWAIEWLYAVAAAGLVEHRRETPDDGNDQADGAGRELFWLTAEMSALLGQPDHVAYAGGVFGAPVARGTLDRLVEAFRTGVGFSWGDHGEHTAHMQASMSAGRQRHFLVPVALASVDGLIERLEAGIKVVDAGCGSGVASCVIAEAFPNSSILGVDPSAPAIAAARRRAADAGLTNVRFEEETFDDLEPNSVDFLLTLDVLHDIPRPADAVAAARRAIADDGVWLVADIKSSPTFEENRRNPMIGLFYAMSVVYCMNSAMSEPGGAGLGTLGMHPERLRGLVEGAGFSSIEHRVFDEDVNNRYFEIRP
jgi:2-polyprenyl-3-methyl-5-hydroxy-6-metoxy-1,4-benzoquinol methylase